MIKTLHIYTRVSSVVQEEDGTSLDTQSEMGIKKANELGFQYKVWNEGGKSSKYEDLDNRPVLRKLMLSIDEGSVDHLFVFNTDRLSRNQKIWGSIRWYLKAKKVKLHTPTGSIDLSSPMDELIIGILSEISQYDNSLRSERSQIGKLRRVKEGFWMGGPPPFGYQIDDHVLVENQNESKWIKLIFQRSSEGYSSIRIKEELDREGVETRRKLGEWSIGSIQKILKNSLYLGAYTYHDKKLDETVDCRCPALIDDALWEKTQSTRLKVLERKGQNNRTQKFYLLRNLMYCGHCGRPMGGKKNPTKREYLYHCTFRERIWVKGKLNNEEKWARGNSCGLTRSLNIPRADKLVWETVVDTISKPYVLHGLMSDKLDNEGDLKSRQLKDKRHIKKLEVELESILTSMSDVETDFRLGKMEQPIYEKVTANLKLSSTRAKADIAQSTIKLEQIDNTDQWLNSISDITVDTDFMNGMNVIYVDPFHDF